MREVRPCSFSLRWNTSGEECIDWTCKDLSALALAIGAYVQPFASCRQAREAKINHGSTANEVETVTIDYASVSA
ncbi:MAG: hypothetical protein LKK00_02015 [Intestinimonas sp.]|nr:hypothetical protein [Intestinimonas sp.]